MPLTPQAEARLGQECERQTDEILAALAEMNVRDGFARIETFDSPEAFNQTAASSANADDQQEAFKARLLRAIRKARGLSELPQTTNDQ